jgi:glutamate dehydrogenase
MATKAPRAGTAKAKAATKGKTAEGVIVAAKPKSADETAFYRSLFARAPAEDIAQYTDADLAEAGKLAWADLTRHARSSSVVEVVAGSAVKRAGHPVSIITVVNDNMPFLLDSVLGEVRESVPEIYLVLHPIIGVKHTANGVSGLADTADADRDSVIQVHVPPMRSEDAAALEARLTAILRQVSNAVVGWRPMLLRLDRAIGDFKANPPHLNKEQIAEATEFLEWLREDNFTFLGMRDYDFTGSVGDGSLVRSEAKGLGILSDSEIRVLRLGRDSVTTTPEIRAFLTGSEPLIVTKANTRSVVHRRGHMDYIGIKRFDADGNLAGELRIVGLFTSTAYTRSVTRIPYLRPKVQEVLRKSGHAANDHSGKALLNVLESFPRDELFQIDLKTLSRHSEAILALGERPRLRVLTRHDPFGRFASVIVFVPRDRYDSQIRSRIGQALTEAYAGRLSAYYPSFPEGPLARVHYIIGKGNDDLRKPKEDQLEATIGLITRTWDDDYRDAVVTAPDAADLAALGTAFPATYRSAFDAARGVIDARYIGSVSAGNAITVDFYRPDPKDDKTAALKIFHHGAPVALSERVPLLENIGFRVISERTFEIRNGDNAVFIHDMALENRSGAAIDLSDDGEMFEDAFMAVWRDEADNDSYNRLVVSARLDVREVVILRAYARYLQQAGIPYGQSFIADTLDRYHQIARDLHALFVARFDPSVKDEKSRDKAMDKLVAGIDAALEDVPSLDDDRILRRIRNLIMATLRTNAFAKARDGVPPPVLALKFDPKRVDGLPAPRPWREIYVYGTQVEGVHLRFGPVARGGLRWSDRPQDYRTEVLGLVKAQQVKNAVIVPVGSKGGFFPKRLPRAGSRDEVFQAGRAAYITFISSLLSLTDNLDGDTVIAPVDVVRHEADDPYFVVAADKGTATFSDTANGVSQDYGFWLDDAFASGGSVGYDHKKMGITARGAWEAVKRHFRERNHDIQNEPFNVVGVGDMSGDVFGNGMLLSKAIRLVAAFDHRDIFIDPDPDTASSFAERQRVFDLGRSSWQDYDKSLISKGGGIFPRSAKSITLSAQAQAAIGLAKPSASPQEIMTAILKAPSDLLWFGGIGTYIRASNETDADVGDKANDAIRIPAGEVGAKVIGEGANLGMTQPARIEFGLRGGACNSDAIDNSAGVNSSDVEVNIKIALASAMRDNRLTRPARDKLLASMTSDVAALVLENNYDQTLALSLVRMRGLEAHANQARFMTRLEQDGLLDREVEDLPSDAQMQARAAARQPLTRSELGVLLAYAKIVLFSTLVKGDLVDDSYLEKDLIGYFPPKMVKDMAQDIAGHRLRREIIATRLANDIVNRTGPSFVSRVQELTGLPAEAIVRSFVIVRDGFEIEDLWSMINALDAKIPGAEQNRLYARAGSTLRSVAAWHAKAVQGGGSLDDAVTAMREARKVLEPKLLAIAPDFMVESAKSAASQFKAAGAPEKLGTRLANMTLAGLVPEIALIAEATKAELLTTAKAFFAVTEMFRIGRIENAANSIEVSDYYDGLALRRAQDMIGQARRSITEVALRKAKPGDDAAQAWADADRDRIDRTRNRIVSLVDSGDLTLSRLTVAAGLLGDLVQG